MSMHRRKLQVCKGGPLHPITLVRLCCDFTGPPSHFVYMDSVGVLGVLKREVADVLDQPDERLSALGLST